MIPVSRMATAAFLAGPATAVNEPSGLTEGTAPIRATPVGTADIDRAGGLLSSRRTGRPRTEAPANEDSAIAPSATLETSKEADPRRSITDQFLSREGGLSRGDIGVGSVGGV